ncbi:MAG: hypothetical protein ABJM29_00425 [Rhizobiaceae bacterium]|jgi:hypothetical protein
MPTLWLFDIEPHEQRYTSEWQVHLPMQLSQSMANNNRRQWKLGIISGCKTSGTLSPGAFMNFAETNFYKAVQIADFAAKVQAGQVKPSDRVLFADAWHPGVIHCKYMSELLGLGLTIDVMWHAGSYDPYDFLGRKVKDKAWSFNFERSIYEASSRNYFATKFHRDLFIKKINPRGSKRSRIVGWPMEYLPNLLKPYSCVHKTNTIVFPHRLSKEKQPKALQQLSKLLPGHKIVFAQSTQLSKPQYHQILGESVAVFSANQQETLGIGIYEGLLCGAVPIVPMRLSYEEMYSDWCYPSSWSRYPSRIGQSKSVFAAYIRAAILARNPTNVAMLAAKVGKQFFNGSALYAQVLR